MTKNLNRYLAADGIEESILEESVEGSLRVVVEPREYTEEEYAQSPDKASKGMWADYAVFSNDESDL